ncbi:hypothetical protein [Fundidesulfovibrio terrae]|uniref:hypothetical protein n=1 Tax=Fundidesulfovibrio terrae TaxID=2922866 RepID=UPI001FAF4082|nr:hypothetical protein [Fundidesulfovibrio terrae]
MKNVSLSAVFLVLLAGLLGAGFARAGEDLPAGFGGLRLGDPIPARMEKDFRALCAANTAHRPTDLSNAVKIVAYSRSDREFRGTAFTMKESDFDDFTMRESDLGRMFGKDVSQVAYYFENDRLSRVRILLTVTDQFEKQALAKVIRETHGKASVVCEDNSSGRALYLWRRGEQVFSARYDADNFPVNIYSLEYLSNTPYYQIMAQNCDDPL